MGSKYDLIETDVLVIGCGGAGAYASIAADALEAKTLIVDRGISGKSGATVTAGHICCAAIDKHDSPEFHFEDTVRGGYFVNNQKIVDIYARQAPNRIRELDAFGGNVFIKRNREFDLVPDPGGHTRNRSLHHGFRMGPSIMRGLMKEVDRRGINRLEDTLITRLLTFEGAVVGAAALDLINGKFLVIKSKSTVLATGGFGQLYPLTTTPVEATGDGVSMAFETGAELVDMEFVQFLAVQIDPRIKHMNICVSVFPPWRPRLREKSKLLNALGEEFMPRYDAIRKWHTTRDIQSLAAYSEVKQGKGTPRGGVFLDLRDVPPNVIEEEFGNEYSGNLLPELKRENYDLSKIPMEIAPEAHFCMGGVRVNERSETSVPGLFVAGEAAGGCHGANRLGGNALSEILVFGKIAGESAVRFASAHKAPGLNQDEIEKERLRVYGQLQKTGSGRSPLHIYKDLRSLMWEKICVLRNGKEMQEAIGLIEKVRAEALPEMRLWNGSPIYNMEWTESILLPRRLDIAEAVARAALERKESRGAHQREDYPRMDNKNWLKNIVLKKIGGKISLQTIPATITKLYPEGNSGQKGS